MDHEDGSFDLHQNGIYKEIMSCRRRANFDLYLRFPASEKHNFRSRIFKSEIYAVISPSETFGRILERDDGDAILESELTHTTTPIRLVSDGRRAFVKFLDV